MNRPIALTTGIQQPTNFNAWAKVLRAQTSAPRFTYFDAATAAEVEAIAETILPRDDTPGARDAGVISFIDRPSPVTRKTTAKLIKKDSPTCNPAVSNSSQAPRQSPRSTQNSASHFSNPSKQLTSFGSSASTQSSDSSAIPSMAAIAIPLHRNCSASSLPCTTSLPSATCDADSQK